MAGIYEVAPDGTWTFVKATEKLLSLSPETRVKTAQSFNFPAKECPQG
jgi:hypothetical protein